MVKRKADSRMDVPKRAVYQSDLSQTALGFRRRAVVFKRWSDKANVYGCATHRREKGRASAAMPR